jgi:hypothetical protein
MLPSTARPSRSREADPVGCDGAVHARSMRGAATDPRAIDLLAADVRDRRNRRGANDAFADARASSTRWPAL